MRAKEVIDLLGDDDKIREERKKAKENKTKYTGVSSAGVSSFSGGSSGGRFGGFGSDSYAPNDTISSNGFSDQFAQKRESREQEVVSFEHYKVKSAAVAPLPAPASQPIQAPKVIEANLLDFGNDAPANEHADDWGDFAAAPVSPATTTSFANFSAIPTTQPVASVAPAAPVSHQGFADFNAFSTPASVVKAPAAPQASQAVSADPLAQLVSLDPTDFLSSKPKSVPKPTLNAIQATQLDTLSQSLWK